MRRRRDPERGPQAIDPASGFKVPLSELVRQYDGEMVARRFVDRQNPQDFVRAIPDKLSLPYARPEPPDQYLAQNILWEDGQYMTLESGGPIFEQGQVVSL